MLAIIADTFIGTMIFDKKFKTAKYRKFLFDYRMRLAVLYLLDSDMAINDIGIKLGYDYQSHFCTAFKRKYGVSPIEYRAMLHTKGAKSSF